MGDGPLMPWRLLAINILVEDREIGGSHSVFTFSIVFPFEFVFVKIMLTFLC